ncbi:lipid-A-disaccharide synthase [Azotobacter chroococcum]|nr:lipid-A-disaccharide synthase [Azotobacter chroococcum]TBV92528.1 lipid-A-disaccharide synthase [Azotobacter chroococcum]
MACVMRVALVAGEASGDILGASLMQALKAARPDIEFIGVGGPRMQAEGLQSYFPMERLAVMGLFEVLGRLPELLLRRRRLIRSLLEARPDVYIGIDAPDFNLGVELRLRRAGIRTVHYVSPSVWAWRQKRVLKIRQACDLMLTLFPFEAQFYEAQDVPVRFVGHPLADQVPLQTDRDAARAALDLTAGETIVALMPGSRGGELARLGPLFLEAAERLLALHAGALRFVVPCASSERRRQLEEMLSHTRRDLPVMLLDGRSHEALAACDAVLIASGTATLEALLYKRPMVVAYRLAPLTYKVARHLVKTPFFSLPNLLAGRALVPELLQERATPEALAEALMPLLEIGREQAECFDAIHRSLRRDASHQAAESVLELAERA